MGWIEVQLLPDTSSLEGIKTLFDDEISTVVSRFHEKLDSLVDPLISQLNSVPYDPKSATDSFDRIIPAFSLGIGDSKNGIYGDFVVGLTNVVDKVSQLINVFVSNATPFITTQAQVDDLQKNIGNLSTHIASSSSSASDRVASYLTDANNRFSSAITISQQKSSEFFINSVVDSYLGSIKRADERAASAINTLVGIYSQYNSLPPGFYEDADSILSEIASKYNSEIDHANTDYNSSISSYKYWGVSSQSQLNSGQIKIGLAITQSNTKISGLFSSTPLSIRNKTDYAMSIAFSSLSGSLFTESIRVRNSLYNLVFGLSKRAESTILSIDRYVKNSYVPIYVDGASYRNSKSTTVSGISAIVFDDIRSIVDEYNNKSDVISSNYSTALSALQKSVIDYINSNVTGLTEEQLALIESRLSSVISSANNRVSVYFTMYSTQLSVVTDGVSGHLTKVVAKYYDSPPLLRYTGNFTTPSRIRGDVDNVFTVEVTNIGQLIWNGWFGIRLSGAVDESVVDYVPVIFKWNMRSGFHSVVPGQTRLFTITIPGSRIFNLGKLGSSITPSIIVNTDRRVSKSLYRI